MLAQRLAEGCRQHPSNAAFGQWMKANGLGHLTHRDRAALLRIATLDPEEASDHIRRSSHTSPEHLWYRALRHLAVRKTALVPVRKMEPEAEVGYAEQIEKFLERLRLAHGDDAPEDWYQFFDEQVIHIAAMLLATSDDPPMVFGVWLDSQTLFDLDDDDRDFLVELIGKHHDTWFEVVQRMRKTPGRSGR